MRTPFFTRRGGFNSSPIESGYTLGELLATLVILSVVAAFLFPVFAKGRSRSNRSCASSLKQVGLAMMGYCQDYDDHFPPAAQPVSGKRSLFYGWASTHDAQGESVTLDDAAGGTDADKRLRGSLLFPYSKQNAIFHCPSSPAPEGAVTYRYNDLASGQSQGDFVAYSRTVLLSDGEPVAGNVGHSCESGPNAADATLPIFFAHDGKVIVGARLQAAAKRHADGANYCFADGHVKWVRPQFIFFPSRFSDSPSHKDAKTGRSFGPDPAKLSATPYSGTFHVK